MKSNQISISEQKRIESILEYYLITDKSTGVTVDDIGWSTTMQTPTATKPYLWNYELTTYSIGETDKSTPEILAIYAAGRSISNIKEYYAVTNDSTVPPTEWKTDVTQAKLSATNKYLWNQEEVLYTDNTSSKTDPTIIGVYGDSGDNAIHFGIASAKGIFFSEDVHVLDLTLFAFDGSAKIIKDAQFNWYYLDEETDSYITIKDESGKVITDKILSVAEGDEYAFKNLKATMTYKGNTYEDFVTLAMQTTVYTAVSKFFDSTNILYAGDEYLVLYLDVYRNNELIDTINAPRFCAGVSTYNQSRDIIIPTQEFIRDKDYKDKDKVYFICRNNQNGSAFLDAILGQYDAATDTWDVIPNEVKYTYQNSLHANDSDNILVISKEEITRSLSVNFAVIYEGKKVCETNVVVIDSNDPIIGDKPPENPVYGQLWFDTSKNPPVMRIYQKVDGEGLGVWKVCVDMIGKTIYTEQPTSYKKGDLWILENTRYFADKHGIIIAHGAGTMVVAIQDMVNDEFNINQWRAVDENSFEVQKNINQYFNFNQETGLTIGDQTPRSEGNYYYVNLKSDAMNFCEKDAEGRENVMVSIGNQQSKIQNMVVEGSGIDEDGYGAKFNCNVKFNSGNEIDLFGLFIIKEEIVDGEVQGVSLSVRE